MIATRAVTTPVEADVIVRLSASEARRLLRLLSYTRRVMNMLDWRDVSYFVKADLFITRLRIVLQNVGVTE